MTVGSERDTYSYEPFTRHPFYETVNRALVEEGVRRLAPAPRGATVVDLSCGTGAMTLMVIEALRSRGVEASIVAAEPSSEALAEAERRLAGSGADVRFVQGGARRARRRPRRGRSTPCSSGTPSTWSPTSTGSSAEIAGLLAPGGVFAFNSAFFEGAYVPGTEPYYRLWTLRALRRLRREHPQIRLSREARMSARGWLSREDYADSLRRNGFDIAHCALDLVRMDLASFQDIGRYWLFIEGALPGVPLAAGADALAHGAAEAFEELGLDDVPRHWLQVVGSRPAV